VRATETRFVIPRLSLSLPGEEFVRPRVWEALQGPSHEPVDRWAYPPARVPLPVDRDSPHDRNAQTQAVALLAAAFRDIAAVPLESVGKRLAVIRGTAAYDDRKTRRAARDGRALWTRLAAWPWLVSTDYDAEWWRREDVIELWHEWAGD
jgi:hypothetical protein